VGERSGEVPHLAAAARGQLDGQSPDVILAAAPLNCSSGRAINTPGVGGKPTPTSSTISIEIVTLRSRARSANASSRGT